MRVWNAGWLALIVAGLGIAGCSFGGSANGSYAPMRAQRISSGNSSPIKHVVVVIQENRTFDNLFATFPGADGTTTGEAEAVPVAEQSQCPIDRKEKVNLTEGNLAVGDDFGHKYSDVQIDYENGNMDGFDVDPIPAGGGKIACLHPYQYVNPSQIAPYWDIAQQYVLADHMYQTQGSGSFTAHQDLIAGGTAIDSHESIIDDPSGFPWGCDSPSIATTSLFTTDGQYEPGKGPFPCFTQYETLRDRLDAAKISWKYYTEKVVPPPNGDTAGIWNAFDAISAVRHSAEWGKKVTFNDKLIFKDISAGHLPAVSWVTPDALNSDHPQELEGGKDVDYGPSWVASIVNAIGKSKYWKSSAIVILWDDYGGFYDHESPVFFDNQGGLGFRVPMLIVSPYARETSSSQPGYISHTQYETASILKFVEVNWGLKPLQLPDTRATSIGDSFNFFQKPRSFSVIPSEHSQSFFLHQTPSGLPPDTE
jgi:phospholipase C